MTRPIITQTLRISGISYAQASNLREAHAQAMQNVLNYEYALRTDAPDVASPLRSSQAQHAFMHGLKSLEITGTMKREWVASHSVIAFELTMVTKPLLSEKELEMAPSGPS